MTRRQKIFLKIGSGMAFLTLLFPPIYQLGYGETPDGPTFYIFVGRVFDGFAYFDTTLDVGRLALELIMVIAFTVAGIVWFRGNKQVSALGVTNPVKSVSDAEQPSV